MLNLLHLWMDEIKFKLIQLIYIDFYCKINVNQLQ